MLCELAGRSIGESAPVCTIAEIGLNHGGSPDRALQMVDAAAWAGASAVKLQTIVASALVAASCPPPAHVRTGSLRDFFATFELDLQAHRAIVARARSHGLAAMTTVFDEASIPALETVGFDAYKIASGDLTYDGLIAAAAATGRPLVISTGMSRLAEVGRAVRIARRAGATRLALLHCVSAYPAPAASENLRAIQTLLAASRLPVGLSDHGSGLVSAVAAVALGASLYERHLVLDGDDDAIDRAVSSTPSELRAIVRAMEQARLALGTGRKACQPAESVNLRASRRGLYARRPMRAGEQVTPADVAVLRPAGPLAPSDLGSLIGRVLDRDIPAGDAFGPDDLAGAVAA
jgi:sialic acid synthase SpsE